LIETCYCMHFYQCIHYWPKYLEYIQLDSSWENILLTHVYQFSLNQLQIVFIIGSIHFSRLSFFYWYKEFGKDDIVIYGRVEKEKNFFFSFEFRSRLSSAKQWYLLNLRSLILIAYFYICWVFGHTKRVNSCIYRDYFLWEYLYRLLYVRYFLQSCTIFY